jgi:cytochrome c
MRRALFVWLLIAAALPGTALAASLDEMQGLVAFRNCQVCHSVTPDQTRTDKGPSLYALWGRKAGGAPGASEALKSTGILWDDQKLDKFLANPASAGLASHPAVRNDTLRKSLVAFLKDATAPQEPEAPVTGLQPAVGVGIVIRSDGESLTVKHGDIPGVMPAMQMRYAVASPDVTRDLRPGNTISFVIDPNTMTITSAKVAAPQN